MYLFCWNNALILMLLQLLKNLTFLKKINKLKSANKIFNIKNIIITLYLRL